MKDRIRQDCVIILRRLKAPKININRQEHQALGNLRNNVNLAIDRDDKGGATIVMNQEYYNTKMIYHLSRHGSYRNISNNPITNITKEVKRAIKNSILDEIIKKRLLMNSEITPRIYGLPKIHKNRVPLRSIVTTINSPTYELSKYVEKIFIPFDLKIEG
jgi:hypothetical protein